MTEATGPLKGVKILEIAGIGPGPLAGMMLSDMGADVLRVERKGGSGFPGIFVDERGRTKIELDFKKPEDIEYCLKLAESADVIFEGFRPGVMERLGLGPDVVLKRNPKIVYGRMTGWGQEGPYAQMAGHDMNYLALSGALFNIGPKEKPVPPLNLIGDYGGGGVMLVVGILAAVISARSTGKGQVVDAAMCDGVNVLMAIFHGMRHAGQFTDGRGIGMLNGGLPFYDTYECKDGEFVSIGSIEPQFYAELLEKTGLAEEFKGRPQMDPATMADLRPRLTEIFKGKTRDEWSAIMEGSDCCFAPILKLSEAYDHPHAKARGAFVEIDGIKQPAPAPRFSGTPSAVRWGITKPRPDVEAAVSEWLAK
jgi:alpha-methylacyl-CoA racemase